MTTETQVSAPRRSGARRFFSFILFRIIPALLILGIFWSVIQILTAFTTQYNAYNHITARREAYIGTATAIAPAEDTGIQDSRAIDNSDVVMIQFATNTPQGAAPTAPTMAPGTGASGFATSTPAGEISEPTAVNVVPATPVPTQLPIIESTTIPLPTFFPPNAVPEVAEIAGTAVPTQVPLIARNYELVNILLLGTDDEIVDDGVLRTDTMIVVSINTETRTVAMLSLPRDLFVYIPTPTMTRLNTVYGIGESFGWDGGGFGLLRQTIFYNFGINVHYYARVNFTGFETIINTLGGVDIAVDCAYTDYYPKETIDLSLPLEENYYLRTLEVGYYTLDGFDALWYARTRKDTTDFDRGRRQQQLLRSIFRKALSSGQLSQLPQLWGDFTQVVETNLPFETMLGLLPIALNLDPDKIENFAMVRTYHTTPWQPPSGALAGQAVQLPNYEPIYQLLTDFYTPPTESQLAVVGPSIAVFNGTPHADWDKVAAAFLREEGYNAYPAGAADNAAYANTVLKDLVGDDKSSLVGSLTQLLNVRQEDVSITPDANRQFDYQVIVGENYNSCDAEGMGQ